MAKTPVRKPRQVSLRYVLESEPTPRGGSRCKTCQILESLEEDDAAALREFLADSQVSAGRVVSALQRFGVTVSTGALSRHRRQCL